MSNELTDVRCPCGAEFQADSYDAGFIAGSGMCQNCDAALPPKDICTCPSGNGSLRHPCPAHPAAAEQAGTNVGHGHVFPRADGVKMRCGGPELCSECAADAYRARAALAQPSPAQAEQAEPERPEVVAVVRAQGFGRVCEADANTLYQHCSDGDELMTVAQHERIVGALRAVIAQLRQHKNDYMDSGQQTYRALQNEIREREAEIARLDGLVSGRTAERDAALARVAELERQEPVALANRGLHAFWVKWTEAAAGLYGPGIKLYAAPVVQAQHSVPKEFIGRLSEFLAQRGATGKALLRELRALCAAAPGKEVGHE
ncbi:hypothetical protein KUU59_09765 [Pseudomonas aeruginosa]|uniref:hypothetical protein n=1 Tax=Pseudomonas aeruginosa TaxID=287 RepID=UPI00159E43AF|nr:hypothetical protein [Pseudomonas aeruginosa]MBV5548503.1 hypothetical protein [Pseudomonas aeruginosa]MBV5556786.1 hypothetical protein [Pseudomonas aeruginosa]MBV6005258.1 hypothetical protein [Pseudomonas aeruginosa]MBV6018504.1 hypothetical protein [Pseudomonas aeruginosa]MBV6030926.1 hypothetical protein [Pseudomonas aeruginosa]